jgi:hypothetical protein
MLMNTGNEGLSQLGSYGIYERTTAAR